MEGDGSRVDVASRMTRVAATRSADIAAAVNSLKEKGYAVIENVISEEEATQLDEDLWQFLSARTNGESCKKGRKLNVSLPTSKGIILHNEVSHCKAAWDARLFCLPYFACMFGTGDLFCSQDRVNVMPGFSQMDNKRWWHADQARKNTELACVQGYLDLFGTDENCGGLMVAEKSHLDFTELLADAPCSNSKDFVRFTDEMSQKLEKNYRCVKVQCPPRSFVLWDSRTIHCNEPPNRQGHERTVFYVCMLPRSCALDGAGAKGYKLICEKKAEAFRNRVATSHWPIKATGFSAHSNESFPPSSLDVLRQPVDDPCVLSLVGAREEPAVEYEAQPLMEIEYPQLSFLGQVFK